jgi:hypothetical protein
MLALVVRRSESIAPYVSPVETARAIVEADRQARHLKLSRPSDRAKDRRLYTAQRIALLGYQVQRDLEDAEATWGVFSWVAWAPDRRPALVRQRADIALHLRRNLERPLNGWWPSHMLAAALQAWEDHVARAKDEHRVPPRVDEVPDDVYLAAMANATTKPRKSARKAVLVAPQAAQPNGEQMLSALATALYQLLQRGLGSRDTNESMPELAAGNT